MQGGPGGPGLFGGGAGVPNTKKPEKRSGTVWLAYYAATSRILCRRFQWAKAQGTPFRCLPPPPRPDFKVLGGGKGEVKPPNFPTRQPSRGYMYVCMYVCMSFGPWATSSAGSESTRVPAAMPQIMESQPLYLFKAIQNRTVQLPVTQPFLHACTYFLYMHV